MEILTSIIKQEKDNEAKQFLFADDMISYVENPKKSSKKF
jgi:hypothetical protein